MRILILGAEREPGSNVSARIKAAWSRRTKGIGAYIKTSHLK